MSRIALPRPTALAGLVALSLGFAGCSLLPKPAPDPTRHYVLTGAASVVTEPTAKQGVLKVGVRSVQVAPYLDAKSMIVRRGDNEIDYRDYARWAEPLATGINRMLVARLHVSDKVARVFPQPYPFDIARDVDVSVSVLRCEGRVLPDGSAVASFLCTIEIARVADADAEGRGGEVLLREVFEAPPTPWKEGDYAALAALLSDHVARLADTIIAALPDR
jgi:Uncharacterized protein conserved in bacteria